MLEQQGGMKGGEPVHILLLEDDAIDVEAIRRSFVSQRIANPLYVASDGVEGLEYLRDLNGRRMPRPCMVIVDINMPRMNGIEFIRELRQDKSLNDMVVFVLTTSDDERDIAQAYDLHVAGYILKSRAGESFVEAVRLVDHYWRVVELPKLS